MGDFRKAAHLARAVVEALYIAGTVLSAALTLGLVMEVLASGIPSLVALWPKALGRAVLLRAILPAGDLPAANLALNIALVLYCLAKTVCNLMSPELTFPA
jgi:hypothetical protein